MPIDPVPGLLRMIDAGANRAREGLRVLDDVARFVLDDAELTARLRSARHGLTSALRAALHERRLSGVDMLDSRDTPGDVGTSLEGGGYSRTGLGELIDANAGRAQEALRSLEECCKLLGAAESARSIETIRYGLYDVQRTLAVRCAMGRGVQPRLCVLLTESLCAHHPWERVLAMALQGGADCVQLREKHLTDRELLARARVVVRECARTGAVSVINDRVDIALRAGARGVHLGQEDLPAGEARALSRGWLLIGVSTGDLAQARAAVAQGADLCGVGPMFTTTTKHKPHLAGPAYLREYLADPTCGRVPHLAIGGITPANIRELASIGCRGVAVSSVVCGAMDPAQVCEDLRTGLDTPS